MTTTTTIDTSYKKIGCEKYAKKHYAKTGDNVVVFHRILKRLYCSLTDVKEAETIIKESPLDLFFIKVC